MKKYLAICSVMLLGACASDTLFPNTNQIVSTPASQKIEIATRTGTLVGQKVGGFKNELNHIRGELNSNSIRLEKIRGNIILNTSKYHDIIASLESNLQLGTTPSNPKMVALLNNAQNTLQDADIYGEELNNMAAEISSLGTKSAALAGNIRAAYAIPGAVDEDHANLRVLENGVEQTAVAAKNLLNEVAADAIRQQQALQSSRAQLIQLNNAVARGSFGVDNAPIAAAMSASPRQTVHAKRLMPAAPSAKPLFTINFSTDDVQYQAELETAINNTLKLKPNARFEVVAFKPVNNKKVSTADSKKYAAEVFADMISMGVSPEDIILSAKANNQTKVPQVLVFAK